MLLIPTGIGCAIGGYAGDAIPIAKAIATVADCLITHPNVMNGAQLYWPLPNVLYVEGYALDQFAAGHWALQPVHRNRIGVVFDQAIEPELRLRHLQVMDAARATLGLSLTDYGITDAPLGVRLQQTQPQLSAADTSGVSPAGSGATWGTLDNPGSLLRTTEKLLRQAEAEAIAVVTRFPDDSGSDVLQQYRQGHGVDPIAGAEAVISHLIVRQFRIPCAHAPALTPLPVDASLAPRSAAEELGYTFFPCVLVGLSRAPRYIQWHVLSPPDSPPTPTHNPLGNPSGNPLGPVAPLSQVIQTQDVDVVITPATACGGSALLSWGSSGPTIIAVEDNTACLSVLPEPLGLKTVRVRSYLEGLGVLLSLKAGVNPHTFQSEIPPLRSLR